MGCDVGLSMNSYGTSISHAVPLVIATNSNKKSRKEEQMRSLAIGCGLILGGGRITMRRSGDGRGGLEVLEVTKF